MGNVVCKGQRRCILKPFFIAATVCPVSDHYESDQSKQCGQSSYVVDVHKAITVES